MRRIAIGLVVFVLVFGTVGVRPAHAEQRGSQEQMGPAESLGWGMAAIGTNLVYIPVKIVWAVSGSLTALLAWGFSAGNSDVAMSVLQPSLGGTWVVTPEMMRGDDPILFMGPSYEAKNER